MISVVTSDEETVVDPRAEAQERVGGRFDARVLEPSPAMPVEPPWFADDPVTEALDPTLPVLAPVSLPGAATTWDELASADSSLAPWCAERWLGAWTRLVIPADVDALVRTRNSWHALAEHVLAPARHHANGKIGLRYTRRGFGTPFYADSRQVRVDGGALIVIQGDVVAWHGLKTVGAAAEAVGIEPGAPTEVYTPTTPLEPDEWLVIHDEASEFLGDWFGFSASVLEELRAGVPPEAEPARVQLWPEHFDLSVDFGAEQSGRRATYGASPGDEGHATPYLYVTPWSPQSGPFWNEGSFASLSLEAFADASDQRAAALDFFTRAERTLAS
jgi:hypothetical protein